MLLVCPAGRRRRLIDRTRTYCGGMDNEQAFPVIRQTVLDTIDPRGLAEFYRQLFGLRYRPGDEPPGPGQPDPKGQGWLVLKSPAGGAALAFQKVGELPGPRGRTARSRSSCTWTPRCPLWLT